MGLCISRCNCRKRRRLRAVLRPFASVSPTDGKRHGDVVPLWRSCGPCGRIDARQMLLCVQRGVHETTGGGGIGGGGGVVQMTYRLHVVKVDCARRTALLEATATRADVHWAHRMFVCIVPQSRCAASGLLVKTWHTASFHRRHRPQEPKGAARSARIAATGTTVAGGGGVAAAAAARSALGSESMSAPLVSQTPDDVYVIQTVSSCPSSQPMAAAFVGQAVRTPPARGAGGGAAPRSPRAKNPVRHL